MKMPDEVRLAVLMLSAAIAANEELHSTNSIILSDHLNAAFDHAMSLYSSAKMLLTEHRETVERCIAGNLLSKNEETMIRNIYSAQDAEVVHATDAFLKEEV